MAIRSVSHVIKGTPTLEGGGRGSQAISFRRIV